MQQITTLRDLRGVIKQPQPDLQPLVKGGQGQDRYGDEGEGCGQREERK